MHDHKMERTSSLVKRNKEDLANILCFDKNEFMKINFSVDEFLHKNRHAPSLEQLRDNLGLYLKGLRTSLIDLINEDYADFVSLSANLVGLDQSIDTIRRPLENLRSEIESIQALIMQNESDIRAQLQCKRQLREVKRNLQSFKKVCEASKKLEDLLANQLSCTPLIVDLERAALELIQLKYNEKYSTEYLSEAQVKNITHLQAQLHEKLRATFNESLQKATATCSEQLERCLRIYITLDACHLAESAFRDDVVGPYMSDVISEHSLQNSPQGLAGVYSKILNFISLHMTNLLRLTQYTDNLCGFDFVVNSFWADVEMRLETHMSSIFAPGNSEVFYVKYKYTRDFVSKIEQLLANEQALQEFRQHKQTRSFQARWNLPVYFQICFQEIAGQFETVLVPLLREDSLSNVATCNHGFQLSVFNCAHQAFLRCWAEGVYLQEVFPKFYKLSVQLVLRLSRWIADVIRMASQNQQLRCPANLNRTNVLIVLHVDTKKFVDALPTLEDTIVKNIPKVKAVAVVKETVAKSLADLQQTLSAHMSTIKKSLVDILIIESGMENIRQVNDLPRLYRKTNRDVPTRSSTYVEQILRPLKMFAAQQKPQLGRDVVEEVLAQVFSKITTDYYAAVLNVLTSVQKTEESLRRLRNLKTNIAAPSITTGTMSDDDKIRLQLRVDVIAWTTELAKLNFMPTQIEKLLELNQIVEDSIKTKDSSDK